MGKNGRVKADLYAKIIVVEGSVQGNLFAEEKIIVKQSGDIGGNLVAPRINLEEGAKFKGSIDMEGNGPTEKQRTLPEVSTKTAPGRIETGNVTSRDKSKPLPSSK